MTLRTAVYAVTVRFAQSLDRGRHLAVCLAIGLGCSALNIEMGCSDKPERYVCWKTYMIHRMQHSLTTATGPNLLCT